VHAYGGGAEALRHDPDLPAPDEPDDLRSWPSSRHRGRPRCQDGGISVSVAQLADRGLRADERRDLATAFTRDVDRIFANRTSSLRRPNERLDAVIARYDDVVHQELAPSLAEEGVRILAWRELAGPERAQSYLRFHRWAFPLLTPMVVDSTHPMPHLRSLAMNLIIRTSDSVVYLPMPPPLPRLLPVRRGRYVTVQSAAAAVLPELLVGTSIVECSAFRITRSAKTGDVVRLEVERKIGEGLLATLAATLKIAESGVYRMQSGLAMGDAFRS